MRYAEWLAQNTEHYRGYVIRPGEICDNNDDVCWMFHSPLGDEKATWLATAKEIIDNHLGETDVTN